MGKFDSFLKKSKMLSAICYISLNIIEDKLYINLNSSKSITNVCEGTIPACNVLEIKNIKALIFIKNDDKRTD